jgi:hypothetical protein
MRKKNQHVVPSGKDWAVKGAGNDMKTAIVNTKPKQSGLQEKLQSIKNQKW